jgi:hypothetical protein
VIRRIVHLRWKKRPGPMGIADRLSHVDRATGEPIRRYEHDQPGSLLHVDVEKMGKIRRRRRLALRRPRPGRQEPGRHSGQAAQRPLRPEARHGIRAHRAR